MKDIARHPFREALVAARWEAETTYFIADLIREGVHPSEKDLIRLALTCERLTTVIVELGGDRPLSLRREVA